MKTTQAGCIFHSISTETMGEVLETACWDEEKQGCLNYRYVYINKDKQLFFRMMGQQILPENPQQAVDLPDGLKAVGRTLGVSNLLDLVSNGRWSQEQGVHRLVLDSAHSTEDNTAHSARTTATAIATKHNRTNAICRSTAQSAH